MEEKIIEIKNTIEKIRPYIQRDGGDVQFVSFNENTGVVIVKVFGACIGCIGLDSTITEGIEALLLEEVEGVTQVIVEDPVE